MTQIRDILINTLLAIFAVIPFPKALTPSSCATLTMACTALAYPNRCACGFAPSAHMRTRATSAGLPITPAMPPATPAHAMFHGKEILLWPVCLRTRSERAVWIPKRAVEYEPWRRMDAERPVQSEVIPGPMLVCVSSGSGGKTYHLVRRSGT